MPNEIEIIKELAQALPEMNRRREEAYKKALSRWSMQPANKRGPKPVKPKPYTMPTADKSFVSQAALMAWMLVTENPDFMHPDLSRQTAQQTIRVVHQGFKSYFAAIKDWQKRPEAYTGKPKIPGYSKKKSGITATFTNQGCRLKQGILSFPKTNETFDISEALPFDVDLREVRIVPNYGKITIHLVYNTKRDIPPLKTEKPTRVFSIDLGEDNFAAIANNACLPAHIVKGGYIKSENRFFNKERGKIFSQLMKDLKFDSSDPNKRYVPTTKRVNRLSARRKGFMRTEFGRIANEIISLALQNDIDTIVVGVNKGQKQRINMGHKNNEDYVSIPFEQFRRILAYKCEECGIRYIEHEESYTSKASFIHNDFIPTYGEEGAHECKFSGSRVKRGKYKTRDGHIVNADVNGAANIGRKALPDCFEGLSLEPFSYGTKTLFKDQKLALTRATIPDRGCVKQPMGDLIK